MTRGSASVASHSRAASASGCRIARGVVPGPGVIIFDNSTAAIDAVTEKTGA